MLCDPPLAVPADLAVRLLHHWETGMNGKESSPEAPPPQHHHHPHGEGPQIPWRLTPGSPGWTASGAHAVDKPFLSICRVLGPAQGTEAPRFAPPRGEFKGENGTRSHDVTEAWLGDAQGVRGAQEGHVTQNGAPELSGGTRTR